MLPANVISLTAERERRLGPAPKKMGEFTINGDGTITVDITTVEGTELEWELTPESAEAWGRRFTAAARAGYKARARAAKKRR